MEANLYNQTGKQSGTISIPKNVFGLPWNDALVHQVSVSMLGNKRTPVAHTKNRGEVSGSGIKPWRQKGTGRARHGSRRSPIWVGGGVSHGPRNERDYSTKINKKMKTKALFTVLSKKFKDGEVIFLDSLTFSKPKTSDAKGVLSSLSKIKEFTSLNRRKNAAFISVAQKDENVIKSFGNFSNIEVGEVKDLNILDVLQYRYVVVADAEKAIATLSSKIK